MSFYGSVKIRKLIKILLSYGFSEDRSKGSHRIFRKVGYFKTLSIPCHNEGEEAKKYLIELVREATGLSSEEFKNKLRDY